MNTISSSTHFCSLTLSSKVTDFNPKSTKLKLGPQKATKFPSQSSKGPRSLVSKTNSYKKSRPPIQCFPLSCITVAEAPLFLDASKGVDEKLQRIVSEFKSLSEPIDRVKRLLHYAAILPPLHESARVPENRVLGCTTQVWVDAKMDEFGRMRFGADSDSEISKGFCSCLVWMLDGAEPEEVLKVKSEDLEDMNVGLHGKAHSRVNTWHNVLINMQKRTKALVEDIERKRVQTLESFPCYHG